MPSKAKTSHSMWEGNDLARERTSLGKSQMSFASILGLSHRMYCYYESGEKKCGACGALCFSSDR